MIAPQHHMVLVHVRSFRRTGNGVEFFGVVEAAGELARGFRPGDDVQGTADGVYGGYVCVHCDALMLTNN